MKNIDGEIRGECREIVYNNGGRGGRMKKKQTW
jgi:hypothetical protein